MSELRVKFQAKRAAVTMLLIYASVVPAADVNILPIGDSLTKGFVGSPLPNQHNQDGLATYRPYLAGTVSNYLNDSTVNPDNTTWTWLGDEGNTTLAAPPSPITLTDWNSGPNGPFRDNHEGVGGSPAKRWRATGTDNLAELHAQPYLSLSTGPCENVALIMLGTNDLPILGWNETTGTHSSNHQNPLNVIHSNTDTYNGYIPQLVDLLQSYDANIDIFIAAIPPVDQTTKFVHQSTGNSWYWTEEDRVVAGTGIGGWISDLITFEDGVYKDSRYTSGGPDGVQSDTDSNDVIDTLNREIEHYVENIAAGKVTFVNPLVQGTSWDLVDVGNMPTTVDGGEDFDMDLSGSQKNTTPNGNTDLADGLHLSYTGDQKYAAAFWEGAGTTSSIDAHSNLRSCVSAAAAAAVPEPSSFVFLGLVATLGLGANRFRKQATKTKA